MLRLISAEARWVPLRCAEFRRFGATFLEDALPKTLEATFARSTRPLEATPGRFGLAFGALGTSKTNEFLR